MLVLLLALMLVLAPEFLLVRREVNLGLLLDEKNAPTPTHEKHE